MTEQGWQQITSKCCEGVNRDEVMKMWRLCGCADFVSK